MSDEQERAIVNLWLVLTPDFGKYTQARCNREAQAIRRLIRAFGAESPKLAEIRAILEDI